MWCLVKDGMLHEFKRAESRKPSASRLLEGSLALPIEVVDDSNRRHCGFQLVMGGIYGNQEQLPIEYELVDGCHDDLEKWLNSISAASLLAAITSHGRMPQYALDALSVAEEKSLRRERRSRATAGKAAQSWDVCSVSSSALSTASTVSASSATSQSSSTSCCPQGFDHLPQQCSASSLRPQHSLCSSNCGDEFKPPPLPQALPISQVSSVRQFRRRAHNAHRHDQVASAECLQPCNILPPLKTGTELQQDEGEFDV
jgi:hypothetical protein